MMAESDRRDYQLAVADRDLQARPVHSGLVEPDPLAPAQAGHQPNSLLPTHILLKQKAGLRIVTN